MMRKRHKTSAKETVETLLEKFEEEVANFHKAMGSANATVELYGERGGKGYTHKVRLQYPWVDMINAGVELAEAIAKEKVIPKKEAKKFEMASRPFISARRFPTKIITWAEKNTKRINYLINAAKSWINKDFESDSDNYFRVGGFDVHNTLNLTENKLQKTKELIQKSVNLIKKSDIPKIKNVLYGDLFIVGRIHQKDWLAWYNIPTDDIYLRPNLSAKQRNLQTLIHELGHRYWRKILNSAKKKAWELHHRQISRGHVDIVLPEVGDTLPFKVEGGKQTISKIEGRRFYLDDRRFIPFDKMYKWMKEVERLTLFPTPYSSKSAEEHFCEAFSLYVMGVLPGDHVEAFVTIFVD